MYWHTQEFPRQKVWLVNRPTVYAVWKWLHTQRQSVHVTEFQLSTSPLPHRLCTSWPPSHFTACTLWRTDWHTLSVLRGQHYGGACLVAMARVLKPTTVQLHISSVTNLRMYCLHLQPMEVGIQLHMYVRMHHMHSVSYMYAHTGTNTYTLLSLYKWPTFYLVWTSVARSPPPLCHCTHTYVCTYVLTVQCRNTWQMAGNPGSVGYTFHVRMYVCNTVHVYIHTCKHVRTCVQRQLECWVNGIHRCNINCF